MNYKPVYRKNKKLIADIFSTMFWILLLFLVINYSARAQTGNSAIGSTNRVPGLWPIVNLQAGNQIWSGKER